MNELFFKEAGKEHAVILAEYRFKMFNEIYPDDDLDKRKAEIIDECTRYYLKNINNKNHYSIIAFADEKIIGCGIIILEERPPNPRHKKNLSAYILNIYVDTDYRGKGIAKKIMEQLHKHAQGMGVRRIGLHASRFGYGLYKEIGYRTNESYLEMDI
jgi:ribosomal protein S18 acetylase RimI-like enzyme